MEEGKNFATVIRQSKLCYMEIIRLLRAWARHALIFFLHLFLPLVVYVPYMEAEG